ncbi:hypothetical protein BDC45DRAFT_356941 [Circinella umbellata]|nr:hypothetical protein BDC45DRAFT_356941 [Circinella umbellata]
MTIVAPKTISYLPVEVIDIIAKELTLADYYTCTSVSKEWQRAFRHCYRHTIDLTERCTFTSMISSLTQAVQNEPRDPLGFVVRGLKVDDGVACLKDMARLNKLCPNIMSLTFRWAYNAQHNERIDSGQQVQEQARRRFFSTPTPFLKVMKNISRLSLEPRKQANVTKHIRCSAQDLSFYLSYGTSLRRLSLIGVLPQLMGEHLDVINKTCPNLSELFITTNFSISNSINIISSHSNKVIQQQHNALENLFIRCSRREASPETFYNWFHYFGSKYPNLRHLCLEYKSMVSRMPRSLEENEAIHGYTQFTTKCTKLETVKFINLPVKIEHLPFLFGDNDKYISKKKGNSSGNANDNTSFLGSSPVLLPFNCCHGNNENNTKQLRFLNFISEDYTIGDLDSTRLAELFIRMRRIHQLNLCIPMTITSPPCLSTLSMLRHLTVLKLMRTEKLGTLELDEPLSKVTIQIDEVLERCPELIQVTLSYFVIRTHRRAYCSLDYRQGSGYPLKKLSLVDSSLSESAVSFFAYKCLAIQEFGLYTCIYYDESGRGISRFKIHMPYHHLKSLQIFNPKTVHAVPLEWNRELLFDLDHIKVVAVRSIEADRQQEKQQQQQQQQRRQDLTRIPDEYFTVDGLNFFTNWYLTKIKSRLFNDMNLIQQTLQPYGSTSTTTSFMNADDPLVTAESVFDDNAIQTPSLHSDAWNKKYVRLDEVRVADLYKRIKQTSGFPQYHHHHHHNRQDSNHTSNSSISGFDDDDSNRSSKRRRLMMMSDPDDVICMPDPVVTTCHSEAEENGFMTICCRSIRSLSINDVLLVANNIYM